MGAGHYKKSYTEDIQRRYEEFANVLNNELKKHSIENILINSEQTCPRLEGIQSFEGFSKIKKQRTESGGYCQLWSLFIAELALLNQDKTLNQINSIILESKDQKELRDYLRRVARGISLYMSDIIKRYYSIFGINMDLKKYSRNIERVKNVQKSSMNKYFKIYLLLDYELHDRNMTPEQLLAEYEKIKPKKVDRDKSFEKKRKCTRKQEWSIYASFVTDFEVHKASIKLLKAMVKSEKIVPHRGINELNNNDKQEEGEEEVEPIIHSKPKSQSKSRKAIEEVEQVIHSYSKPKSQSVSRSHSRSHTTNEESCGNEEERKPIGIMHYNDRIKARMQKHMLSILKQSMFIC